MDIAEVTEGPWNTATTGTFSDPIIYADAGVPVNMTVAKLDKPISGRYVKYLCKSWYRQGCALQYIGVA